MEEDIGQVVSGRPDASYQMLTEQIVRLDCDRCELQTEHYILDYGDKPMLARCMKCGHVRTNIGEALKREHYPMDNRKPIYVV